MNSELKLTAVTMALLVGAVWGCSQPELIVYESEGYTNTGDYVEMARRFDSRVDVPDFSANGMMNNGRMFHCPDGVWLGHPETNYGGTPTIWDQENCYFSGGAGIAYHSARVTGDASNFTASTLNTFASVHYAGEQTKHYNAARQFDTDAMFESLILMGSSPVELFTGVGQTGLSICVRTKLGSVSTYADLVYSSNPQWKRGTYIINLENVLGLPAGSIKSFTFGCRNGVSAADTIPAPAVLQA